MNQTVEEIERLIIGCVRLAEAEGCLPSHVRRELRRLGADYATTQRVLVELLRKHELVADKDFKLHVKK